MTSPTSRCAWTRRSSTTRRNGSARLRAARDAGQWQRRIGDLKKAAAGSQNVLVPLREALRAQATVGEVCDALREVWGVYQPAEIT